ncbi:DinB superfamily protein [Mucilaginibacter gossypiicola]|uniref:DinB superfamily protein n=1 Tax=Mucilaginibacter gossypiicola TaxID=551995 RepID=A0A1H8GUH5_9SPHI|nr:DinB family protein [Mucilaginibacter gossypiicola]SEN46918.1 DinB superfamily protein [Mucilaginibacter gossypiicola]
MENQTTTHQTDARINLLTVFENTAGNLLSTIALFNEQQINISLSADSWSAGQIAEHIFKSDSQLVPVLNGGAKPAERNPAEKVKMIKDLFLDFEAKFKSAPEICPSDGPHQKHQIVELLQTAISEVRDVINSQDLYAISTDLVVPFFGELTRLEWLYLICYHTQKHIHQLKNIRQSL